MKRYCIYLLRATLLPVAAVIGLALTSTGCMKRDLERRALEGRLSITLDWGEHPVPAGTKFYFYPQDGGEPILFETSATGFDGALPSGDYRMIVTNTDAVGVAYRGMNRYQTAEVYALEQAADAGAAAHTGSVYRAQVGHGSSTRIQSRAGGPCITEPMQVFGAAVCCEAEVLHITPQGVHEHRAIPVAHTKLVKLIFETSGIDRIDRMSGVFNGVTPSVQLSTGRCAELSCSVAFIATAQAEGYAASLHVFDIAGTSSAPAPGTNTIDLSVETGSGPKNIEIDITETIRDIIKDNDGVIPVEIPIDISLEVVDGELIATVRPWEHGGGSDSDIN